MAAPRTAYAVIHNTGEGREYTLFYDTPADVLENEGNDEQEAVIYTRGQTATVKRTTKVGVTAHAKRRKATTRT